jgi:glutathione S-transferase
MSKAGRVQVYIDLGSQPSRAVLWVCRLLAVPHDLHLLRLDKGETRTPEYLAIHPLGKVPAVTFNDRAMIESTAILIWLCQKFGGDRLYPSNADEQFGINSYLAWHPEFRNGCAGFFAGIIMRSVASKKKAEPATEERLRTGLDKALGMLETYWLANESPFLAGSKNVTIADIQAINELNQVTPFLPTCLDKYPSVRQWVGRMEQIQGYAEMMQGYDKVASLLKNRHAKL